MGLAHSGFFIGPYAKQITTDKLKFWIVFQHQDCVSRRYEISISKWERRFRMRLRPEDLPKGPHNSNFEKFKMPHPDDFHRYRRIDVHRGDELAEILPRLLDQEDIVNIIRVRGFGILPRTEKEIAHAEAQGCATP